MRLSDPFVFIIRGYQRFISPFTPNTCRFYPTCSNYALKAFKLHGLFKGTWLIFFRILRCNPFCKGGVDHVPVVKCSEKVQVKCASLGDVESK